jgi:hypothetical protein
MRAPDINFHKNGIFIEDVNDELPKGGFFFQVANVGKLTFTYVDGCDRSEK